MPQGEEKEQDIGNLFEKIMKENFPNLVKEIYVNIQEAQKVPNKMNAKRATLRHIIKMPKIKDNGEEVSYLQRSSYKTVSWFFKRDCRLEATGKKYSKSQKAGIYSQDCSTQQKYHLERKGRKSFPDNKKLKEFIITKWLLYEMLKGLT